MSHKKETQKVELLNMATYNLFGTPEYCLPLLIDLRDGWLENRKKSTLHVRAIMTINLVILNLEVMIENNLKKI